MAFSRLAAISGVEVLHGADPDVVYDQAPDLCLRGAITAIHQVAVLLLCDGAVLQHIVDLLPDPVVVLAREPAPESFLLGSQFPSRHASI